MNEWISVKEKLPTTLEDVLFTDGKDIFKGYLLCFDDKDLNYWYATTEFTISKDLENTPMGRAIRIKRD